MGGIFIIPYPITYYSMFLSLPKVPIYLSENSMCFVRSWSARAQHSWLVQRGCYLPASLDPLPRAMTLPTRAMTCKHERSVRYLCLFFSFIHYMLFIVAQVILSNAHFILGFLMRSIRCVCVKLIGAIPL